MKTWTLDSNIGEGGGGVASRRPKVSFTGWHFIERCTSIIGGGGGAKGKGNRQLSTESVKEI